MASVFATDEHGMVRQCAWCWRVRNGQGQYRGRAWPRLAFATHGICPLCLAALLREFDSYQSDPERLAAL